MDRSAMLGHDLVSDIEAKPETAALSTGLAAFKELEDTFLVPFRDSLTLIADDDIAKITSIETFDLHQARMPRGIDDGIVPQIIPMGAAESERDYIEKIA